MLSSEAAEVIRRHRPPDAVVVCTMTTIFTFAQQWPADLNLRCAPLMGGASSIGLGIALARPERKVIVLDGDGSLLMQLGTLATIAQARPPNLVHFVFDNGVLYEGGGRVPPAGAGRVDFVAMALAAGYPAAIRITEAETLDGQLPALLEGPGPALVSLDIEVPDTPRWSNERPQDELPDWWFTMMGEDARRIAAALGPAPGR